MMLGGGSCTRRDERLLEAIAAGLREVGPALTAHATDSPPIVGAALLGLDAVGADGAAQRRACERSSARRGALRARALPDAAETRCETRTWRSSDGGRTVHAGDPHLPRHRRARRSTPSICTSATASSWCSSARRGRARRPRCACWRGSKRSMRARSSSASATSPMFAEEPRHRDGVPELRAVPVSDRGRQHRLPAEGRKGQEGGARASCRRGRGHARSHRVPRAQAGAAVRRAAPARGDGPGDHPTAERLPDGRAAVEPRRKASCPDARRHRAHSSRSSARRPSTSPTTRRRR